MTVSDVNDNSPEFPLPHSFSVSEASQVNSQVATIVATDADVGRNGDVTYSLLSNTQTFSIGASSGNITVRFHCTILIHIKVKLSI